MKTDMRTKITILKNDSLKRLHERVKGDLDMLIIDLLNRLSKIDGIYLDDTQLCGMMLPDILHEVGSNLVSFAKENYGSPTFDFLESMSGLQIWGIENDCSDCGCEMEYQDNGYEGEWYECTNCGNEENRGGYYSPDDYRDDCRAELETFSKN